jgi:hypothetical protein
MITKLSTTTKNFAKATIKLYVAKNWTLKAENMEYEISRFIDDMNNDRRTLLEEYLQSEIDKLEKGAN